MKKIIFSTLIAASMVAQADYLIVNNNVSLVSKQYQAETKTLNLPALDDMVIKDSIFSPNAQISNIKTKNEKLSLDYLLAKSKGKQVGYRDTDEGSYEYYTLLNDVFPLFLQKNSKIKAVTSYSGSKNLNFNFNSIDDIVDLSDATTIEFSEAIENPIINHLTKGITYKPSYNIYMDGSKTKVNGYFNINNQTKDSYADVDITIVNADINTNFQRKGRRENQFKNLEISHAYRIQSSSDTAVGFEVSKSKDYFIYNYPGKMTLNKNSEIKFAFARIYSPNTTKYFKKIINWHSGMKGVKFDIHNVISDKIQKEVLPAGIAYVYERQSGKDIFVGTVNTEHTVSGEGFEFSSQKSNLLTLDSSSYVRTKYEGEIFSDHDKKKKKKIYREEKSIEIDNKGSKYADIVLEIKMPYDLIKLEVFGSSDYERKGNLLTIKYKVRPSSKHKFRVEIIR